MLELEEIVYFIAALGSAPIISLVAINTKNRRYWQAAVPGTGALASLAVFVLVFVAPWIIQGGESYTLYNAYKVMGLAGDVFAKSLLLTSIFAAFGGVLWLADIVDGRGVFLASSSIGFGIALGFISSATAIAVLGGVGIEAIGWGAWVSIALYSLNIVLGLIRRRAKEPKQPSNNSLVAIYPSTTENEMVRKIIEEARKALSK
ncbi:MAG: hypothetical protein QW348_05845 [Ignisphaera sp.]